MTAYIASAYHVRVHSNTGQTPPRRMAHQGISAEPARKQIVLRLELQARHAVPSYRSSPSNIGRIESLRLDLLRLQGFPPESQTEARIKKRVAAQIESAVLRTPCSSKIRMKANRGPGPGWRMHAG